VEITQLWRYPVKSLQGERVDRAPVGPLGIEGDRQWGLVDRETGLVLTARRVPELLFAHVVRRDGGVAIRLPDGSVTADGDELSAWLGRPVELRRPGPDERGVYEIAGNDDRPDGDWYRWEGPEGVWHDSGRTRLSILSAEAVLDVDVRRFRPNVVVTGGDERDLLGREIRMGTAVLEVVKEIDRCVMVTRSQPGVDRDKEVLRRIHAERGGNLGVGAVVRAPGTVAVGDRIS
jgi:uncharacterized protein